MCRRLTALISTRDQNMPKPISRREMIRRFRALGWTGPLPGGKHAVMEKGNQTVHIPNPHKGDLDWSLTKRILNQARIEPGDWDQLA